ncbi:RAD59 [Candida jiufengensis]|uniref:RAD59 n=1 Tax=Candida jiufengensis TaxID=497108 RepID=UPI0022254FA1|nr:RAD59 [Candida jiufengensis]KAI5955317.1 RAD59 [Candida jiufengensis]
MPFDDSKYSIDEETRRLPSTPNYFINLQDFEKNFEVEANETILSPWLISKIGILQSRLDDIEYSNDTRRKFNKLSQSQLFNLANEIFGFNGWSTSIEECIVMEKPTRVEKVLVEERVEENNNEKDTTINNVTSNENNETSRNEHGGSNAGKEINDTNDDTNDKINENNDNNGEITELKKVEKIKTYYSAESICIINLHLKDGSVRKGYGNGQAHNLPQKSMGFAKCKKEAITNAIKNSILGLRDLYFEYEVGQLNTEELGIEI